MIYQGKCIGGPIDGSYQAGGAAKVYVNVLKHITMTENAEIPPFERHEYSFEPFDECNTQKGGILLGFWRHSVHTRATALAHAVSFYMETQPKPEGISVTQRRYGVKS